MATALYRTGIAPEWVDYNSHLRDAYYWVIISLAVDALMDRLGMDETYRTQTRCTIYTLEAHIHYLEEVKQSDVAEVFAHVLDADAKRIHAGFELRCAGHAGPAAVAEMMLLHVRQGETAQAVPFPAAVTAAIESFRRSTGEAPAGRPGSRRMGLHPKH